MGREKDKNGRPPAAAEQVWQQQGYHMEDSPCEHEMPVNDQNDTVYDQAKPGRDWTEDPFIDDAVDESLRAPRSPDVEGGSGRFWVGPEKAPEEAVVERVSNRKSTAINDKPNINKKVFKAIGIGLALIVCVWLAAMALIFRIQAIDVTGGGDIPAADIIALSGVEKGQNILTLNDSEIERRIGTDVRLVLVSVEKEYPGHVTLHVRRREPAAYLSSKGFTYVLDSKGIVLEEDRTGGTRTGLLRVEGMDVRSAVVGKRISLDKQEQLTVYKEVLIETRVMKMEDSIVELYVTNPDNLYIATADGFSIRLGSGYRIHAKLRVVRLVQDSLREMGRTGGTIDVSNPEEPTWIPETNGS